MGLASEWEDHPSGGPIRCTAAERTCSAWAFESWRKLVEEAKSLTWNGWTRSTLDIAGTTVTTIRLRRQMAALVPSLCRSASPWYDHGSSRGLGRELATPQGTLKGGP